MHDDDDDALRDHKQSGAREGGESFLVRVSVSCCSLVSFVVDNNNAKRNVDERRTTTQRRTTKRRHNDNNDFIGTFSTLRTTINYD